MATVFYLVLIFGSPGSSTSTIMVGSHDQCVESGEKAKADNTYGFLKYLCVEGRR